MSGVRQIVERLNVIDDILFQKMAEDRGFCEEMISTILEQKVKVLKVVPQNSIKNLQGRSVVLDVLCHLEDGRECNVEVHKKDDDDHVKRIRYNTSCITANIAEPGSKFEKVPNVIGIFISKFDMFDGGKTIYHIKRVISETGESQENGLQEIYVNTKIDDGSDIAELMKIFSNQDAYDFENFPRVSKRKQQFLKRERGKEEMCELVDNYFKKREAETARKFFLNGASYELVRASIDCLSDAEIKEIYEQVKKAS